MTDFSDVKNAERALFWFLEISKVPRGSGNTAPIAEFLVRFAEERGLEVIRDRHDNVIVKKPASVGYETHPVLILQGHTDIVAEKTRDCAKDMEKEGVDVYRDGEFLRAVGTTLGADDGVALAYALAILEDNGLAHPALEAVFTSNEETGLVGAGKLDASCLCGRRMINIDSGGEGSFVVGCAGGLRVGITLSARRGTAVKNGYRLTVSGLLGGHSGGDIALGRANAIKLAARVLGSLSSLRISSIAGGSKDNAIPREAVAEFYTDDVSAARIEAAQIAAEYADAPEKPLIEFESTELGDMPFDEGTSRDITELLSEIPFGVIKMSDDIDGLVETSMNIGIIRSHEDSVEIHCSLRSSKDSEKIKLRDRVHAAAEKYGAAYEDGDAYPGWEYKKESPLRDIMLDTYRETAGKEPTVYAIHAGLECGILMGKIKDLDCISLGPDNYDCHTTEEHLSLPSFARVYEYLTEVLKKL